MLYFKLGKVGKSLDKGRIIQSLSGYFDVLAGKQVYRTRARGNFRNKKETPLVGDWVEFKADNEKEGYLLKILERKNSLVRPPVANIDRAIVVSACREPKLSTNLLDRQLTALAKNNIEPMLYFSKADLLKPAEKEKLTKLVEYYGRFYPCFIFNGEKPAEIKRDFLGKVNQQVLVVMGQTGAGKSTFLNLMAPELNLETAAVSKALSRGKHTTRRVSLLKVANNLIADTPGFSSFDVLDVTKEELPLLYPDFVELQDGCKFRGCLHLKEPKCAVKEAYEAQKILASRYENYLQFQDDIAKRKPKYN